MELNKETVKVGTELYLLSVCYDKCCRRWYFTIYKTKIKGVTYPLRNDYDIMIVIDMYLNHNTDDTIPPTMATVYYVSPSNLVNNHESFVKIKNANGFSTRQYTYLCDSFKTLVDVIKTTALLPEGNEATKRKRLEVYRELVKRWTKAAYKENFYTTIK